MKRNLFRDTRGLTLIELLVTIAVIAVVAAIAVPVVTLVVSNTSDRAAEQQSADIAQFTSKYSQAGTWTYDPDNQTLTGYIDTNGDGQVDADEKVEELTINPDEFTVTRTDGGDGSATPIDHTEASYLYVPDDIFTVTGTSDSSSGSSNLTAPTQQISVAFMDGSNYADDTSLDITVGIVDSDDLTVSTPYASETEAPYLTYAFQIDPAAELDYEQDRDWSDASLFLNDYPDATKTIGNLDTTQMYYIRVWIQNSQGDGPFSQLYRLNYNETYDQWLYSDLSDGSNSSFGTE